MQRVKHRENKLSSKNHEIECPMCEAHCLVEVKNSDDVPEHCPMCGHPIDIDEDMFEDYED